MNLRYDKTKDYERKLPLFAMKKQTQNKPKTNPIKPNFTGFIST
jgi:hypothetical protein